MMDDDLTSEDAELLDDGSGDELRPGQRRRLGLWLVLIAGAAIIVAVVGLSLAGGKGGVAAPAPSGKLGSPLNPTPTAAFDTDRAQAAADALGQNLVGVAKRVVPSATLAPRPGYATPWTGAGFAAVAWADVRARGKGGLLTAQAGGGFAPDCGGADPETCRTTDGPNDLTITIKRWGPQVASGQPRDVQVTVIVTSRSGIGSWVMVTVSNGVVARAVTRAPLFPPGTGEDAPLTEQELVAIALDPALDVCRTTDCGSRIQFTTP